jgi:hypothetical protein
LPATLVLALIHSPIVGPSTWSLVAAELERRRINTLVPALEDDDEATAPYWEQHARSAASGLGEAGAGHPILVAHSGAGPLLPPIGDRVGGARAYVFVDAGLPEPNTSRLEQLAAELPDAAKALGDLLAAGERYPNWSDEELRDEIPDPGLRRRVLAELRPRPARFYEEPIPVPRGWPDAPCGYLQLSAAYERPAAWARERGWDCRRLDGTHFQMLVDPGGVVEAILDLVAAVST